MSLSLFPRGQQIAWQVIHVRGLSKNPALDLIPLGSLEEKWGPFRGASGIPVRVPEPGTLYSFLPFYPSHPHAGSYLRLCKVQL